MYIDIGGNKSLRSSEIVAVMDIETASTSKKTKEFLRIAGKTATEVSDELPRTFIIAKKRILKFMYHLFPCRLFTEELKAEIQ